MQPEATSFSSQPGPDVQQWPDPQTELQQVVEIVAGPVQIRILQFHVERVEHLGDCHTHFHQRDAKIGTNR